MSPGKIAIAATAFACTTLLSVGWSAQHGASLSVNHAQAVEKTQSTENKASEDTKASENQKATENKKAANKKARMERRGASARVARGSHRPERRVARRNIPNPAGPAAAGPNTAENAPAAAMPRAYAGGGPYASAEGWNGAGYASSPWGDYDCRATSKFDCRPYASKDWFKK
jgi:hypothetical protein